MQKPDGMGQPLGMMVYRRIEGRKEKPLDKKQQERI